MDYFLTIPGLAALQKKYPNIPKVAPSPKKDDVVEDPNLMFQDEVEAYTTYKTQGNFTPHPGKSISWES
jgi:hypothetical protein